MSFSVNIINRKGSIQSSPRRIDYRSPDIPMCWPDSWLFWCNGVQLQLKLTFLHIRIRFQEVISGSTRPVLPIADDIVERLKIPPVFLNPTRNDHRLSVYRRALPLSLAPMYTTRHLYSTSNQQGLMKEMLISKGTRRISNRMSASYLYSLDPHFNRLLHRGILDRS